MADREAVYKLAFEIARQEYNQSLKSIADLNKSIGTVDASLKGSAKGASLLERELKSLADTNRTLAQNASRANAELGSTEAIRDAQRLNNEIEQTADIVGITADELRRASQELSRFEQVANRLDVADERFDLISRRVGLAGDFQSNLGALRGISDVAGARTVGTGLGVAGELVVLAEELPRLKQAISNLPDVARFAAAEIGFKGAGLVGALAVAAIAFNALQNQIKDQAESARQLLETQRKVAEDAESLTTEQARQRISDIEAQIAIEQQLIDNRREVLRAVENEVGSVAFGLADITGVSGDIEAFNDEIKAGQDNINSLNLEIRFYNDLIANGTLAVNDAAEAQAALNQEIIDFALASIQAVGERTRAEIEANRLIEQSNKEALASIVERYDDERTILEAQRRAAQQELRTAEINQLPTEQLEAQLNELNDELSRNADTASVYRSALEQLNEAQAVAIRLNELGFINIEQANQLLAERADIERAAVGAIKTRYQEELAFANFIKGATADSIAQRRQALLTEQDLIKSTIPELARLAPTSEAAAAELEAFNTRLQTIDRELGRLNTSGVAQVVGNLQSQLATEITAIQTRLAERIVQIEAQAAEKRADIARDFAQGLRDIEQEALEARQEAQADFAEGSIDIAKDLAKRRAEIERRAALDVRRALEDRDAVALNRARRNREEELTEAQIAAQEAQEELAANYAQQLKTIETETAKQRQELQRKYAQQLRDLQQATLQSINQERIKAQAEIATKQQAYNAQLQQLQSFGSASTSLLSQFASLGVGYVQSFVTGSLSALQQAAAQQAGGTIGDILGTNASLIGTSSPSVNASFTIQATSREAMAQEVYNNLSELITLAGR